MANALPVLRGTSTCLYPFTRVLRTGTDVKVFENAKEQRCVTRPPLMDFNLPFTNLSIPQATANIQVLRGAHALANGMRDNTLSLVMGAITYTNLTLLDDVFEGVEFRTTVYRGQLRLRQTIPQLLTSNANGNVYPTITAQLPYTRRLISKTYVADQESGVRYAYPLYAAGWSGFPFRQNASFTIQYGYLTDTDLLSLEQFFVAMNGRYGAFDYTDPEDGTTLNGCRFDQDDLEIQYIQPNQSKATVTIYSLAPPHA